MNIAIRVDASLKIGTGHFMRCLALADALKDRGSNVRFISRSLPQYLQDILIEKGYEFRMLKGKSADQLIDDLLHAHWLSASQNHDALQTIDVLSDRFFDWLIVDHYALDVRWEQVLRKTVKNILVIDDIADRQHDCDLLLDQNFYTDKENRYFDKVPEHCKLMLGPRYALLRNEFSQWRQQIKPRIGPVKRILVFFGGVDADNYTGQTIAVLADLGISGVAIDVVIGAQHPFRELIESSCVEHSFNCYVQTNRIADLIAKADLAIGAGGSAIWERCCLGLPTFVMCTADNQKQQISDAASEGLLYAPNINENLKNWMKSHLCSLIENTNLRQFISNNSLHLVDGFGIRRVLRNMGCSGIEIRIAKEGDSEHIFTWRNHQTVRAVSRSTELITWEDHQLWFEKALSSPDKVLLIGHSNGLPVGVVRFDRKVNEAEVSIYLIPGTKEYGVGGDLLQSAEHWLSSHYPEIGKILACVQGGNVRSNHLFLGAGYQVKSTSYIKELAAND